MITTFEITLSGSRSDLLKVDLIFRMVKDFNRLGVTPLVAFQQVMILCEPPAPRYVNEVC